MVDGEVSLTLCVHVGDLAVIVKGKETFDGFYAELTGEFPVNDMGSL